MKKEQHPNKYWRVEREITHRKNFWKAVHWVDQMAYSRLLNTKDIHDTIWILTQNENETSFHRLIMLISFRVCLCAEKRRRFLSLALIIIPTKIRFCSLIPLCHFSSCPFSHNTGRQYQYNCSQCFSSLTFCLRWNFYSTLNGFLLLAKSSL